MAPRRGLLVDFGGVLTSNVFASFQDFCRAEGLAVDAVRDAFLHDDEGRRLLVELESGRLDEAEFEPRFAEVIGLPGERASGLVARIFEGMKPDRAMQDAVLAARRQGVRTGMLSNSWGEGGYDRSRFAELFDGVVISSEEGMRKPEPEIYELGARRVGLAPEEIVFVDDLPGNLKPARALGMATVHHVDAQSTIPRLEELLGVRLAA